MRNLFKRSDLIIIGSVLVLALVSLLVFKVISGFSTPAAVEIRVNGVLTASYPLDIDRDFSVKGYDGGTVRGSIKDRSVDVTEADCPDKICVDHSIITRTGESIVCLPNRVVITISSRNHNDNEIDAISGH